MVHPLSGSTASLQVQLRTRDALHTVLEGISMIMERFVVSSQSDVTVLKAFLFRLPSAHEAQRGALLCWRIPFQVEDQSFLHRIHAFSIVSRIVSQTSASPERSNGVSRLPVIRSSSAIALSGIKTSSRPAGVASLTDGSTETIWSDDCHFM